jgi:predicted Zn-ribbon and HTH transcriptional regulator
MGKSKTHDEYVKEVNNLFGNDYTILGIYKNATTKLLVKHNKCSYEWEVYPRNILTGQSKCPNCSQRIKYTTETFNKMLNELTHGEYFIDSEYVNMFTKVSMNHQCGYSWKVRPNDFIHIGVRCLICNASSSKGEINIVNILSNCKANYEQQYAFDDCKNISFLRFDFLIKQMDEFFLIEYDGIQHFEPVDFGGRGIEWAEEQFKETKIKDQIKNQYCKDNNIRLYRIPHWKHAEIESIVNKLIHNEEVVTDSNFIVQ